MRYFMIVATFAVAAVFASTADAQVVVYRAFAPQYATPQYATPLATMPHVVAYPAAPFAATPLAAPYATAPYAAPYAAGAAVTTYSPVFPNALAPVAPYPALAPAYFSAPPTAFRPVYVQPQPIVAYSPIARGAGVYSAPGVVVVGRPVIVRPKYYFPGQPIRNLLRAVTP